MEIDNKETPDEAARRVMTTTDDGQTWPFTEDEYGNLTGYGHQDPTEFAAAIDSWDEHCNGRELDPDDRFDPRRRGQGEWFERVPRGTPGAVPVTWVQL